MKFDSTTVLAGLKDFQLATVEYAFQRLYSADGAGRFLVADEVGLGKTLIARGVIAKVIERLSDHQDQINIIYVCSNGDIARQNIKRLRIPGVRDAAQATRITLLPLTLAAMGENRVNFIALTPATSFEQSRGGGRYDERVLLYALLDDAWSIEGRKASIHVLRNQTTSENFSRELQRFDRGKINADIKQKFVQALASSIQADSAFGKPTLRDRFELLCGAYARTNSRPSDQERRERTQWLGDLRRLLARVCMSGLKPDLIILDEFQRFSHLLKDTDDAGELARDLFQAQEGLSARILLLSATPYRALSLHHEVDDDHYRDFLSVISFLEGGAAVEMEKIVATYRTALPAVMLPEGREALRIATKVLENRLRQVMARTERSALAGGRAMLREIAPTGTKLTSVDVETYLGAQKISDAVLEGDLIEFWKSAPYLFNFMDDYALKRAFESRAAERALIELVRSHPQCFLDRQCLQSYQEIEPANPRLRGLISDTVGRGMWRLLWLPPSLPYYPLSGVFADPSLENVTKRLVFSAWHMVPRAIASLISYEAERLMMSAPELNQSITQEDRLKQRGLLRFNTSSGRLSGLPNLLHVYPCLAFAKACDPRTLARQRSKDEQTEIAVVVAGLLDRIPIPKVTEGPVDERWYWLAPMLIDDCLFPDLSAAWWERPNLAKIWSVLGQGTHEDEDDAGWDKHVEEAKRLVKIVRQEANGSLLAAELGRQPDDLRDVLSVAAIASPATSSLRAITRTIGTEVAGFSEHRDAASRIGHAFLSLFNHPEVTELLRTETTEAFWRVALNYAHAGCLQAVIDEYAHLLHEAAGGADQTPEVAGEEIANAIVDALTLRTTNLSVDSISAPPYTRCVQVAPDRMRNRFAMRFGDQRSDEEQAAVADERGVTRKERVRAAFNSPFWPFVLVSTSVGQEGLDFHHYCHAVTHWNLPSNPVDLEQREGRIHRYKGHAVRKNVASAFGEDAIRAEDDDIWKCLFEEAMEHRPAGRCDLEPYWLFEGAAAIERHVPALPYSRDAERLDNLRRSLAIYRMVFGQSRQEDLVNYLLQTIPVEEREGIVAELQINLSPMSLMPKTQDF